MGCNCGHKRNIKILTSSRPHFTVMGNYKYLNDKQINKRLQMFKNIYCKECVDKQICNYERYKTCKKIAGTEK